MPTCQLVTIPERALSVSNRIRSAVMHVDFIAAGPGRRGGGRGAPEPAKGIALWHPEQLKRRPETQGALVKNKNPG